MAARWAYFDTSVLVKRYLREDGSPQARSLLRRYRFLSSAIAPIEAMSAMCRRRASGELDADDFVAIRSRMRNDRAYWELVEVSPLVLSRAEDLIQQTDLRTLDALHVASALTFKAASGINLAFVTGDGQQRDAAKESGLDVIWVQ